MSVMVAAAAPIVPARGDVEIGTIRMVTNTTNRMPRDAPSAFATLALVLVGLGAGLSPFFFAYYDSSVWVPIGLGIVLACAMGVVALSPRRSGPLILAVGGLLGLGVWSLCSTAWAESVENVVVNGNRWLVYGALLLLITLLLTRHERRSAALLGATGLGVAAVAASVLVRLLGDSSGTLFLNGRLNSPLGYINGEGCLFVMGLWLCMAAAESKRPLVAGSAAAMATLMGCLALLTQSRGTAVAMLGSLLAVVVLVPGRPRRAYGLMMVGAGVAIATPELLRPYHHATGGAVTLEAAHAAGRAALLAAIGVAVVWALLTACWERLRSRATFDDRARTAGSWLLAIPVVITLALAAGSAQPLEHDASTQWHAFTHLAGSGAAGTAESSSSYSRLLSGAGNRYDYWRIAWRVWLAHPVLGVGAGNYPRPYYQSRTTTEDVEQPHSIELQALSELGIVGALLLAAFIGGTGWGISRMRPAASRSRLSRALMVAGVGVFSTWLAQTSVDWMHLLPGLSAIALAGTAVLLRPRSLARTGVGAQSPSAGATPSPSGIRGALTSRTARALGGSAVLAALVLAGASLSRQGLADIYRARAKHELEAQPASAITDANRSLGIDSDAVETYYIEAAAFARFDQAAAAQTALRQALEHEPNNFVTWALLGDIALRERRTGAAKRDYARAHELNPRDLTLRALVVHLSTAAG